MLKYAKIGNNAEAQQHQKLLLTAIATAFYKGLIKEKNLELLFQQNALIRRDA
ncbi:MAG: hypothetical protein R3E08_08185 [Thiotrichaceae bacterium]